MLGLALAMSPPVQAATLVVNTTSDADDGVCNAAHCSLREAINAANLAAGEDVIAFNIPGSGPHTIQPASPLPAIASNLVLDGTSQPGFTDHPLIELDGSLVSSSPGLEIAGSSNFIRGLAINRFMDGVVIDGPDNLLLGNYIGTDPLGLSDRGNLNTGITIHAPGNRIGDVSDEPDAVCRMRCNLISGNNWIGLRIVAGADGTHVTGNMIGTDASGSSGIGNNYRGVSIENASLNSLQGNLISGNGLTGGGAGVAITGGADNRVEGNRIGTNRAGTLAIPNAHYGVALLDTDRASILRNLISGNTICGLYASPGSTHMLAQGNLVGSDIGGATPIPNASCGVAASGESGSLIGGTEAGQGNLILGNLVGISVASTGPLPGEPLTIQGNTVTDNTYIGIHVLVTQDVQIGGSAPGAGNVITGNAGGINFTEPASFIRVQGNRIGVRADGTPDGNQRYGIFITGTNNLIGGTEPGEGNEIAHTTSGPGIHVLGNAMFVTEGNRFLGNSIHDNAALGIELSAVSPGWDGVTPNDPGDADGGANALQNFPVLASATTDGATTTIGGTLNSASNQAYRVEFFANPACHAYGYGEGERYLGFVEVVTDGAGNASFTATGLPLTAPGEVMTGTATDLLSGNTSEFSACATVAFSAAAPIVAAIETLSDDVDALVVSGDLTLAQADKLNGFLDRAIFQVEMGHKQAAIAQMNGFVNQVDRYVKKGDLDQTLAAPLKDSAQHIIGQIESL